MQVITHPHEMASCAERLKAEGKRLGFVPTMGALHAGHKQLVEEAKRENEVVVTSIFINPLQFNDKRDLEAYPRDPERDLDILRRLNCTIVYMPDEKLMYPSVPTVSVDFGKMADILEGKYRPGHFAGVGVIVIKLLNQIRPDSMYLGLKDLQQYLILKKLIEEWSFPLMVKGVPTIRNKNGLALSSRNARLSETGLKIAEGLYQGLMIATENINNKKGLNETNSAVMDFYKGEKGLDIEYFSILKGDDLSEFQSDELYRPIAVCVAGYVEGVRLIDNVYLQRD